ncbi:MAG: ABC transporter ATP-binding protein [Herpetosiphon sp.]
MNMPAGRYARLLKTYFLSQHEWVWGLTLLLGSGVALQLFNPQIMRAFLDLASRGAPLNQLQHQALLFIGTALVVQVVAWGTTYLGEQISWRATNRLRIDLAAHVLRLDLGFHKRHAPGEMIERIDGDVQVLSNFFSQFMIDVVANLVLLVGIVVVLAVENWRVGLTMGIFAVLSLGVLLGIQHVAVPYWAAVRETSGKFYGFIGEYLGGTTDIRANGATPYVMHRFYEFLQEWFPQSRRGNIAGYSIWLTTIAIVTIGMALAFGVTAVLWSRHALTIGSAYLIFYYITRMQGPIQRIRTQMQDLQKAGASIERVEQLLVTRSQLPDTGTGALPAGALSVTLEHVAFGYDGEPPILRDVSLHLPSGHVLGVLGRTGSGKTTLARLLLRLYDAQHGNLCIAGRPIKSLALSELRRRVALVTQDVQLVRGSVRDNLTWFDPTLDDRRIAVVLQDLGLGRWLQTLPQGLDTYLEGADSLSAGEAQLLTFARVFLRDPDLIILDEASARLDPATEARIESAIGRLLAARTGIIIAHRLATIQLADDIVILDRGQVVEYGTRIGLLSDPHSRLSHLMQAGLAGELIG